jgi:hypothetical protein
MVAYTDNAFRCGSARTVAVVRSGMVSDSLVILGSLIILPIVGVGLLGLILAY